MAVEPWPVGGRDLEGPDDDPVQRQRAPGGSGVPYGIAQSCGEGRGALLEHVRSADPNGARASRARPKGAAQFYSEAAASDGRQGGVKPGDTEVEADGGAECRNCVGTQEQRSFHRRSSGYRLYLRNRLP